MTVNVYAAQAMSGRPWLELLVEASYAARSLESAGITVYSPVLDEWARNGFQAKGICTSGDELEDHWRRDKVAMVKSHILVDLTPTRQSHGVSHEIGFFRYTLWRPCVRIMSPAKTIAYLEDDLIVATIEEAAKEITIRWGTRRKRAVWRMGMLWRSLPKWVYRQAIAWS